MTCAGRGDLGALRFTHRGSLWNFYRLRDLPGFFNAVNILIWNFPAEVASLAALFHMLFQEDRAPGVCRECAGRGQKRIPHTILHGDFAAQKLSKRRHSVESAWGVTRGSIVPTGCYFDGCGKLAAPGFGCTTRSPAISTNSADAPAYPKIAATTGNNQDRP